MMGTKAFSFIRHHLSLEALLLTVYRLSGELFDRKG
jgi:hypothetical protein